MKCSMVSVWEEPAAKLSSHVFVWTIHHALIDGWSLGLLYEDLIDAYLGKTLVQRPPYRDFLSFLNSQDAKDARKFWLEQLRGALPTPYPRTLPSKYVSMQTNVKGSYYIIRL